MVSIMPFSQHHPRGLDDAAGRQLLETVTQTIDMPITPFAKTGYTISLAL
jgi:hypothetical protein